MAYRNVGEFVEVYGELSSPLRNNGPINAVVTCFFIDTAKNILQYIRLIAGLLESPGGIWSNVGPLLYHFVDSPSDVSVELSWEEIQVAIRRYFEFLPLPSEQSGNHTCFETIDGWSRC